MFYLAKLELVVAVVAAAIVFTVVGVAVSEAVGDVEATAVAQAVPVARGSAAQKPSAGPITTGVSKSPIIVAGTIRSRRVLVKAHRLFNDSWTKPRCRVSVRVTETIKGYAAPAIEFDHASGLLFEPGKSYVLFLDQEQLELTDRFGKRKVLGLVWSPSAKRRVEATPANVATIRDAAEE